MYKRQVAGNSNISGEAAQQLAAAALRSKALKVLSGVPIEELREDKHTSLELREEGLGPTEGIVLAELIKFSAVLTSLDLSLNELGPEGGKAIAEALKSGKSVLTKLNVELNYLGDAEKQLLRDAVKGRKGFKHLETGDVATSVRYQS